MVLTSNKRVRRVSHRNAGRVGRRTARRASSRLSRRRSVRRGGASKKTGRASCHVGGKKSRKVSKKSKKSKKSRKVSKKSKKSKKSRKVSKKSKKSKKSRKVSKKSKKSRKVRKTRKTTKKHDFKKSLPVPYNGVCPAGFIVRNAYKTDRNTKVPARCIRKLTDFPIKREMWQEMKNRQINTKESLAKLLSKGPKKCPSGMILRKGSIRKAYTRSNGKRVGVSVMPATCIKDLGAKGKNPRKIPRVTLRKGSLGMYGYADVDSLSTPKRHAALARAVEAYGPLTVMRKVQYVATLNKRTDPKTSRIFQTDAHWIRNTYGV